MISDAGGTSDEAPAELADNNKEKQLAHVNQPNNQLTGSQKIGKPASLDISLFVFF